MKIEILRVLMVLILLANNPADATLFQQNRWLSPQSHKSFGLITQSLWIIDAYGSKIHKAHLAYGQFLRPTTKDRQICNYGQ
jgi:hypothetical protein